MKNIFKQYGSFRASDNVNFAIEKGKLVALLGPSGSGKTTLLRCLNFLEHPDNGLIRVNGETLFDASVPATTQESVIRKKRLHFGLV
jgi:polar amino acid transport system ATP-binding protein